MRKRRSRSANQGLVAVVVFLVVSVLVSACAQQAPSPSAPNVTAQTASSPATQPPKDASPAAAAPAPKASKPIKLSMGFDQTGASSGSGLPQFRGADQYFRMINDQGGIEGARLDVLWADTQYKVPVDVEYYKRAKDQGSVLHMISSTPSGIAMAQMAADDQTAVINGSGDHTFMVPAKTMFSSNSPYPYQPAAALTWFIENWKESRAPRVAWLGWDNPAVKGPAELVEKWASEKPGRADGLKYQWAGAIFTAVRQSDFSTYLLKLKELKPDVVVLGMDPVDSGAVARDAKRLGLGKAMSWVFMQSAFFGPDTVKIAGAEALEGWMYPSPFESVAANLPGSAKIREVQNKYQGFEYDDPSYVLGWISAAIATEGIKIAVKEVGVSNLTRRAVLNAMYRVKELDTGGLTVPITLTKDKVYSQDAMKMWRIGKDGKATVGSNWIKVPRYVPGL